MTGLDLDALEAVARAATPGPWTHQPYGEKNQNGDYIGGDVFDRAGEYLLSEVSDSAGAHIATFDPPTVLDLIALAREEQQKRAEAEAVIARIEQLCAETDVDTTEAIQAWLVENIGAVLASYKTTNDENGGE